MKIYVSEMLDLVFENEIPRQYYVDDFDYVIDLSFNIGDVVEYDELVCLGNNLASGIEEGFCMFKLTDTYFLTIEFEFTLPLNNENLVLIREIRTS